MQHEQMHQKRDLQPTPVIQGQALMVENGSMVPATSPAEDLFADTRAFPPCKCGRPECKPDNTVKF